MRGDMLKFKFRFPIELLCWVDNFVLRNPARTPSAEPLQMLEGLVEHRFTIEPESIGTLPVHISLNLKDHFDKLNLDQVKKIAFGLTDDDNKPLRIMLRIKPYIMVGNRAIMYPVTIDAKRDFVF